MASSEITIMKAVENIALTDPISTVLFLVGGALTTVSVVVLARVIALDPIASLGFTRLGPALAAVDEAVLVRDPLSTVVPAVVLWELVGVAVVAVAADYRADRDIERPPLATAYEKRE